MNKKLIPAILLLTALLTGCTFNTNETRGNQNLTTDTWSSSFQDTAQKIDFLKKYVTCPSGVIDTEFHINYHDNGTGLVPGPSDWNITVAVQINPADLLLWIADMHETSSEEVDLKWWDELLLQGWNRSENPIFYQWEQHWTYLVAYPESGVVLKYATTMK